MKENNEQFIAIRNAAALMGRRGGKSKSKGKLDAVRTNALRKKKINPGPDPPRQKRKRNVPVDVPVEVREAAALLGRKGGSVINDVKLRAVLENLSMTQKWHFTKKTAAVIGTTSKKKCFIPDEVAQNPEAYKDKHFSVLFKSTRAGNVFGTAQIVDIKGKIITLKRKNYNKAPAERVIP